MVYYWKKNYEIKYTIAQLLKKYQLKACFIFFPQKTVVFFQRHVYTGKPNLFRSKKVKIVKQKKIENFLKKV